MAKIKITESQLKMIAKHKALNEDYYLNPEEDDDESPFNSGNPIFDKIEKNFYTLFGKAARNLNKEELSTLSDTIISLFDQEWGLSKSINESFVEPKKFKHQYSGELRDAVNKLRKITPEMMDSLSEEKMMELDEVMSNYDDGVGDDIMEIVHSIGDGRYENDGYIRTSIEDDIIDIVYDRIASKGTDKNFIFDAIDDFAKFFGVDDGEEDEYGNEDMPGFEGTMNDLDNLSIREDSISLNEGQLLLKKVYNQYK